MAKLDRTGDVVWQRCYGNDFTSYSVLPTREGGVLRVGEAGDPAGGSILKLGSQGEIQWNKSYHPALNVPDDELDAALTDAAATGNGYLAIGRIESDEPDKAWILGLDLNGNLLWQKTLTGFGAAVIRPARDGNFIIAGSADLAGGNQAWLLKLDSSGQRLLQKLYRVAGPEDLSGGSSDFLSIVDVQETAAGDYLLAGETSDFVPDESPEGDPDLRVRAWIAKLDPEGRLIWRKIFGEEKRFSLIRKLVPASDGGFFALGAGGEMQPWTVWLAKFNEAGEIVWQKFYGRDQWGDVFLEPAQDGRLLLGGASLLGTSGDWLLELDPDGSLPGCDLVQPAAVSFRDATLQDRAIVYEETPPAVTVLPGEAQQAEERHVVALPACPAAQAFGSCKQIQEAGKSYGDGRYPIALQTAQGSELLGGRCVMNAFGGGWLLIAGQRGEDRRPPADFVNLRFGEYDGEFGSFSVWPDVDLGATEGLIGLSWLEDFQPRARLLSDLNPRELKGILATSPQVDAWVR